MMTSPLGYITLLCGVKLALDQSSHPLRNSVHAYIKVRS